MRLPDDPAQGIIGKSGLWRDLPIALLLLALTLIARAQTFGDPVLGFDEQYYLLVADRMLHGAIPYVDIWDRKPIGLFLIYALALPLGPDPFLQYKLLAAGFVAITAFALYRMALRHASRFGALSAAVLYILWLNIMEGEGGQSPVFYNLPMLLAAALTQRALKTRQRILQRGCLTMLLAGIAIQIKYTAVFEGIFFGLCLLWAAWKADGGCRRPLLFALPWIALALAPTAAVLAFYAGIGETDAFLFANIFSIFGRRPDPAGDQFAGFILILALLAPIAILAILDARWQRRIGFPQLWALAALGSVIAFGSFLAPGYGLPVLTPLCLCAAGFFTRARRRTAVSFALNGLALLAGQIVVHQTILGKGGRAEARQVAAAARPSQGCLWVYDGYPALYMLTGSCVPTKWAFPGHLNTADEASIKAIGVDPAVEVRRILATKPDVIVDDFPAYRLGNAQTRHIVQTALARDYRLAARIPTGPARYRLVYRRKRP